MMARDRLAIKPMGNAGWGAGRSRSTVRDKILIVGEEPMTLTLLGDPLRAHGFPAVTGAWPVDGKPAGLVAEERPCLLLIDLLPARQAALSQAAG